MHRPHEEPRSTFRHEVPQHQLLTIPVRDRAEFPPIEVPQSFPDPVFPQLPESLGPVDEDETWRPTEKRHWTASQARSRFLRLAAQLLQGASADGMDPTEIVCMMVARNETRARGLQYFTNVRHYPPGLSWLGSQEGVRHARPSHLHRWIRQNLSGH